MKRIRFTSGTILAVIFTLFVGPTTVQLFAQGGTWTTKTSSPSPRRNVGVAVLNGMVYAVGGAPPGSTSSIGTVEAYNPLTDSWTTKASMPVASQELTAAVINGKLYAVGGGTCCGAIATLQAYDPVTDSWSIKTSMPTPRYGPAAGVLNGILYVVGGGSGYGTVYSNLEAYDPTTDSWTEKAPIPTFGGGSSVASVNGILYAIGGQGFGPPLATVEAYDPTTDTWVEKAPMPTARTVLTASAVNGIIYAIGGSNGSGDVATVEAYDPATDTWTAMPPMPAAMSRLGSGVVNGVVYTLGPVGDSDLMVQAFTPASAAATPTLKNSVFFGGAGDQRGAAISGSSGAIYVSGDPGLILKYSVPPASTPTWFRAFDSTTNFYGIASNTEGVYVGGGNFSLTSDPVGGKEAKSLVSKFPLDGTLGSGPAGSVWTTGGPGNLGPFFSYSGWESFQSLTTTLEGGSNFIYAAGIGQPCSYQAYIVAKYDSSGHFLAAATDSTAGVSFGSCFIPSIGGSGAFGVAMLNGNIYLAGISGWAFEGSGRPGVWKYDSNLNLLWRAKDTTLNGSYNGITSFGGSLYAVGYSNGTSSLDYLIEKLDESGNVVWRSNTGGPNDDVLTGVVGIGTRLFAVGYTRSEGPGGADVVILEIDPATGNILSKTLWGGAYDDIANGAATDGTDLFVVGESRSFASAAGNLVGSNDVVLLDYGVAANRRLVANAGPDQTVECASHNCASVTLNGSASSDPNGGALTFKWTDPGNNVVGTAATATVTAPMGITAYTLTVTDPGGLSSSATTHITVQDTTPPVLALPITITVDASSPAGATVAYAVTATDICDSNPKVTCTPTSGSIFPMGTSTVNCTSKDGSGNAATGSFSVIVNDAAAQVSNLVVVVNGFDFAQGVQTSLDAKLQAAQAALAAARAHDIGTACNQMNAFINYAMGQSGKQITVAQANQLIAAGLQIKAALGCP